MPEKEAEGVVMEEPVIWPVTLREEALTGPRVVGPPDMVKAGEAIETPVSDTTTVLAVLGDWMVTEVPASGVTKREVRVAVVTEVAN